jgi:hypothetical protein
MEKFTFTSPTRSIFVDSCHTSSHISLSHTFFGYSAIKQPQWLFHRKPPPRKISFFASVSMPVFVNSGAVPASVRLRSSRKSDWPSIDRTKCPGISILLITPSRRFRLVKLIPICGILLRTSVFHSILACSSVDLPCTPVWVSRRR